MNGHFISQINDTKDENIQKQNLSNDDDEKAKEKYNDVKKCIRFDDDQDIAVDRVNLEQPKINQEIQSIATTNDLIEINTKIETKCPKLNTNYSVSTSNRYQLLECYDSEDEEIIKTCQSKINDEIKNKERKVQVDKKGIGLFDSEMIKLAKHFPTTIKTHFDHLSEKVGDITFPNPNSELGFIETKIGFKGPKIQVMVDNGSTNSIISSEIWEKVRDKERYELAEGKTNFVGTTEGSLRGIKRVVIPFFMNDRNGRKHKSVYVFYVVSGKLPHQAYLGRDWLHTSPFCKGILADHFILID